MLRRLILFALFVAIGLIVWSVAKKKKARELDLDGLKIAENLPLFEEALTLDRQIEKLCADLPESISSLLMQDLPECMAGLARLARVYESLQVTRRAIRKAEHVSLADQKQSEVESQVGKITGNLRTIYGELLSFAMSSETDRELGENAVQKTESLLDELRLSVRAEREISESVRKNQDLMRGLE